MMAKMDGLKASTGWRKFPDHFKGGDFFKKSDFSIA